MSRTAFEGTFPCSRPPEGFVLSRGLCSLPTGAGWPDEYLAPAHKLSLSSPKVRAFLRQKSRFGCKIRHKRSSQLQAKWFLIFVVLSAEQSNLRPMFCCCSLAAGVLTGHVNLDYSLKYELCSSCDHLHIFWKLLFLHLSLEFLDKLILYGVSISGWDNLILVAQSQSSTTEPKHLRQKKADPCERTRSSWHKVLTGSSSLPGCIENNHQPYQGLTLCSSSSWFGINRKKLWPSRWGGEEVDERPFQGTVEAWMGCLGCRAGAGVALGGSRVYNFLMDSHPSILHGGILIPLFNPNERSLLRPMVLALFWCKLG